ncbi:MAG: shikimate dehydrogenase [Actinomycetaceae bacterium]
MSRDGSPEVVVGQDVHAPGVRRRAAVVGSPVEHSLSPTLHRAAYAQLGLEGWAYGLQDVTVEQLPAVLAALDESWVGLSVTMPLKLAATAAVDVKDPVASLTGVVNTVAVQPGGLIVGANTDVAGITGALADAGVARIDGPVVVLGARATASSAVVALGGLGARELTFVARNVGGPGSALPVAPRAGRTANPVRHTDASAVRRALAEAAVVVSTLPRGVADPLAALVHSDAAVRTVAGVRPDAAVCTDAGVRPDAAVCTDAGVRPDAVLLDVVYGPRPTPLAAAWASGGGRVAEGWGMLLHQAAGQVRLWSGRQPDLDVMRSAITEQLAVRAGGAAIPASPAVLPPAR